MGPCGGALPQGWALWCGTVLEQGLESCSLWEAHAGSAGEGQRWHPWEGPHVEQKQSDCWEVAERNSDYNLHSPVLFGGEVGEGGCGEGVFLCFSSRCSDLLLTGNKLQQSVYAECFDSDNNWWLTSLSLSQPVRFLFFHPISPLFCWEERVRAWRGGVELPVVKSLQCVLLGACMRIPRLFSKKSEQWDV